MIDGRVLNAECGMRKEKKMTEDRGRMTDFLNSEVGSRNNQSRLRLLNLDFGM